MADDEFQDELVKRNSQIADLREELWGARDRVDTVEERAAQLLQGIQRSQAEVGIRRAKANGLEDQVDIKQAQGEETARSITTNAARNAAEVARAQHELHSLDQSKSHAKAEIEQEQIRQEQLHVQLASLRAKIDRVRQDTERERIELEREEADEEERQARNAATAKRKGAIRVEEAEEGLADVERKTLGVQSEVAKLNRAIASERDCCEGLLTALRHTTDKHREAEEQCAVLTRGLLTLEAREAGDELQEQLSKSKREVTRVKGELAEMRQDNMMNIQSLQGGLEETRRMMLNHADQQQHVSDDPALQKLRAALRDAQESAEEKIAEEQSEQALHQKQREETAKVEEAARELSAKRSRVSRRQIAGLEEDLLTVQREMLESRRLEREAADFTRRLLLQAEDAERAARSQEAFLRNKLEEVWYTLRQYA